MKLVAYLFLFFFYKDQMYKLTENLDMVLQDVILNKQCDVGVDLVNIVFFMKLVEEIRINILVEQIFMYALVYFFEAKSIMFS